MPSLTKKDFQMVAGVLHRVRKTMAFPEDKSAFDYGLLPAICADLRGTNPAFDTQRFITAVETGKETR